MQKHDGAPALYTADQPAFVEAVDERRYGKYFAGARKVVDLAYVGVASPDADADVRERRR
jgi:hypothetical protein